MSSTVTGHKRIREETWYAELANDHLGKITVKDEEEFGQVTEALKSVIDPKVNVVLKDELLSHHIRSLKEILAEPELYIQEGASKEVFTAVIVNQVAAKIESLNKLSSDEKKKYIQEQSEFKQARASLQAAQKSAKRPREGTTDYVDAEKVAEDE